MTVTLNKWHGVLKLMTVLICVGDFMFFLGRNVWSIRSDVQEWHVSKKLHTVNEQED